MWKNDIDVPNYEGNRRWLLNFCDAQIASNHGEYNKEIALSPLSSSVRPPYFICSEPHPHLCVPVHSIRRGKFSPFSCSASCVHLHELHESRDWLSVASQFAGVWPLAQCQAQGSAYGGLLEEVGVCWWTSCRTSSQRLAQIFSNFNLEFGNVAQCLVFNSNLFREKN